MQAREYQIFASAYDSRHTLAHVYTDVQDATDIIFY
jgi:hypothetical protein